MSYKHSYSLSRRKMLGLSLSASSLIAAKLASAEMPVVREQKSKDTNGVIGHTPGPARGDQVRQSLQQALSQFQPVRDLELDQLVEPAFTFQAKPYDGCE